MKQKNNIGDLEVKFVIFQTKIHETNQKDFNDTKMDLRYKNLNT